VTPEQTVTGGRGPGGRPASECVIGMYRRILLVEDEVPLRRVIVLNLAARGQTVDEVGAADEAIERLRAARYDLMLLDICLPDRTGWDVLREMRELGLSVPTVVVSAVRVSASRLREFQPLGYLPKPFPLDALLRIVGGEPPPQPAEASEDHGQESMAPANGRGEQGRYATLPDHGGS
jgi:CheY-like chemotaxis protein